MSAPLEAGVPAARGRSAVGRTERAAGAAFLVLLALHAGALWGRHGLGLDYAHKAVFLFHLDFERNLPTLYSAALLAWLALRSAKAARGETPAGRRGWLALGGVFAFLAADEALALHERLMRPLAGLREVSTLLTFGWIVPYAAAGALLAAVLWPWLRRLPVPTRWGLLLSGGVYVAGAVLLEAVGGWAVDGDLAQRGLGYDLLVTVEEGLEVLGVLGALVTVGAHRRRRLAG